MVTARERASLVLNLMAAVNGIASGTTVRVAVSSPAEVTEVHNWCRNSGNSVYAVHEAEIEVYRGSMESAAATLAPHQLPGYRLWFCTLTSTAIWPATTAVCHRRRGPTLGRWGRIGDGTCFRGIGERGS